MDNFITKLCYSEDNIPFHNHYHLSSELVYVLEGEAEFIINNNKYLAKKGSIVFINSFEQHELNIIKTPYKRYFMTLNSAELQRVLKSSSLISIFKNRPIGFKHCINLEMDKIENIFHDLFDEYNNENAYSYSMITSLLEQVLIHIYREIPSNFAQSENNTKTRIEEIQLYIENHFKEDIKITDIANDFFINSYYLSHIFKKHVGYSPKQYLVINRLSYAKELLETTDLQISQISSNSGFSDTNNFIRTFKEYFEKTPKQFKNDVKMTSEIMP